MNDRLNVLDLSSCIDYNIKDKSFRVEYCAPLCAYNKAISINIGDLALIFDCLSESDFSDKSEYESAKTTISSLRNIGDKFFLFRFADSVFKNISPALLKIYNEIKALIIIEAQKHKAQCTVDPTKCIYIDFALNADIEDMDYKKQKENAISFCKGQFDFLKDC